MLFLFFCPASVYQQSFLGGEQTAAATTTDASAQQYRNQQCKPIRLATFEFDFKKQRSQRQDNDARAKWKDHHDAADSIDIHQRTRQQDGNDVVDFANGNCGEDGPLSFSPDYFEGLDNLSRSMHDLIDNLNDNGTSQRRPMSRSAASSLNSIPENLTCNYHSSSSIRCDDIVDRTAVTPENRRSDQKNGNSPNDSRCSNCETPRSSTKFSTSFDNRRILYNVDQDGRFDTDDFRNSNATASTSSDSLTGGSSTCNDIETSDSFVNIQFARLACGQKSSSTQSMESTDSFENVSFRYTSTNNRPSQIPLKLKMNSEQNKSPARNQLQTRIAALNVSKLPKLDNQPDRKNCNSLRTAQETAKCTKNEPVKLRHERYINKKIQMDPKSARSKRYSCFSPCVTKRSAEEIGSGDNKVTQRKFSSTDELREQNEQRQQKPAARTKRFSLYYTPQPLRKTYESETKTGRPVKPISRVHKSEVHKGRNGQETERIDRARKSVVDASTVASRCKSNKQNVHVKSSVVVNANRTK